MQPDLGPSADAGVQAAALGVGKVTRPWGEATGHPHPLVQSCTGWGGAACEASYRLSWPHDRTPAGVQSRSLCRHVQKGQGQTGGKNMERKEGATKGQGWQQNEWASVERTEEGGRQGCR